jgi:lipopolysaccharide export LptBFGC system permease protein LptF
MMIEQSNPNRVWLATASFILSLLGLCTLPLPLISSTLLGVIGSLLGGVALWRIQKNGGTNRDRLFAIAGIIMGLLPIFSLCITLTILVREIPRVAGLLSNLFR